MGYHASRLKAMEPEASLSWLAQRLTPDIAARLTARLLHEFGTPEGVFPRQPKRLNPSSEICPRLLG